MENKVYFISGMDTNIGKSYSTGYLAREWNAKGIRTITQKMIQTGNSHVSEDIKLHRHFRAVNGGHFAGLCRIAVTGRCVQRAGRATAGKHKQQRRRQQCGK